MPASPSASVIINCPFDKQYQRLFDAIVFCVAACGFVPRCTLELTDAADVRIENIYRLIASVITVSTTFLGQKLTTSRINSLGSTCHWSWEFFSAPNDLEDARLKNAV